MFSKLEKLFSAGSIEEIDKACHEAPCGKLTPDVFYIHSFALPHLPPLLRVYEGCVSTYMGSVEGANIIRLNRLNPKISYFSYPDFETDPHPSLFDSLTVSLASLKVRYRDYSHSDNPPILHRKEEFVPKDHPSRPKFERITRQVERWGLCENPYAIGTKEQ